MSLPSSPSNLTWLTQLHMLQSALGHDPTNPLAWRWKVRIKVLSFLVSRYGGDTNLGFVVPPRTASKHELPKLVFLPYEALPVHSHAVIRKLLEEIAAINRDVR